MPAVDLNISIDTHSEQSEELISRPEVPVSRLPDFATRPPGPENVPPSRPKMATGNKTSKSNPSSENYSNDDRMGSSQMGGPLVVEPEVKITKKEIARVKRGINIINVTRGHLQTMLDGNLTQRIDFVVVYTLPTEGSSTSSTEIESLRERFLDTCTSSGFDVSKEVVNLPAGARKMFIKLHCRFETLCEFAEKLKIEMPLADCEPLDDYYIYQGISGQLRLKFSRMFETEDDEDYISTPYLKDKHYLFDGCQYKDTFFRNATRGLISEHILETMDARKEEEIDENEQLKKWNLSWFMHHKVFEDSFVLHDESSEDPMEPRNRTYVEEKLQELKLKKQESSSTIRKPPSKNLKSNKRETASISTSQSGRPKSAKLKGRVGRYNSVVNFLSDSSSEEEVSIGGDAYYYDARKDLHYRWCKLKFKQLPLWRIRNYFGEKIGLYFAWVETLIFTLWIPMLAGIGVFIFGLVQSVQTYMDLDSNSSNSSSLDPDEILDVINTAVDNELTPIYSLIICLWGTVFLEIWKRRNATLKYEWDVNQFEVLEPDRPQFKGVAEEPDPFTGELIKIFPFAKQLPRLIFSLVTVIFMVAVVIAATLGVIIYRAFSSWKWQSSAFKLLFLSTGLAAVMNAVVIQILEKIYKKLAYVLTDWENHRTQTQYDDALIIKIFAFYFVNSYASLFYIAFLRGNSSENGILGLGYKFKDECANDNCMSELAFQTLILMIAKPLPKFFMDFFLPKIMAHLKNLWSKWRNSVSPGSEEDESKDLLSMRSNMMVREYMKPPLGDFTLDEYLEKAIQFGFQVLFAPSLPLGPLIALVFLLIDIRFDPRRMLWDYRRPIAYKAADIGTWYPIFDFLANIGVVVNALLIAFTGSSYKDKPLATQLTVILIFEHVVFCFKILLAYLIPDTPSHVELAIRKEEYEAQKRLEEAAKKGEAIKSSISYKSSRELLEGTPYKQIYRLREQRKKKRRQRLQQLHQA